MFGTDDGKRRPSRPETFLRTPCRYGRTKRSSFRSVPPGPAGGGGDNSPNITGCKPINDRTRLQTETVKRFAVESRSCRDVELTFGLGLGQADGRLASATRPAVAVPRFLRPALERDRSVRIRALNVRRGKRTSQRHVIVWRM